MGSLLIKMMVKHLQLLKSESNMDGNKEISHYPFLKDVVIKKKFTPELQIYHHIIQKY